MPPQGTVLQIALSQDDRRFAVIRQDLTPIDIYELVDGHRLTALTPPSTIARVPTTVSFEKDDTIVVAWALHVLARQRPIYVTAHRLPRDLKEAIAMAQVRLEAFAKPWSPSGPAQAAVQQ
jgi:hypothetical protein